MKNITIYQENTEPVFINDDSEEELSLYSKQISSILESNNISILQTKFTSVIIRPSKIISIVVKEQIVQDPNDKEVTPKDIIQTKKHSKKKESKKKESKESVEKDEYILTDE